MFFLTLEILAAAARWYVPQQVGAAILMVCIFVVMAALSISGLFGISSMMDGWSYNLVFRVPERTLCLVFLVSWPC